MVSIASCAPAASRMWSVAPMISGPMPSPCATVIGMRVAIGGSEETTITRVQKTDGLASNEAMVFISVTRLRLRSARFLFPFLWSVFFIRRQLTGAEGNRGFQLRNESQMTFWTLSAWTDEAAMKAFMLSGPHR